VYTDSLIGGPVGDGSYYFNYKWRSGYTNDGNVVGNWGGREAQGAQAWSNYRLGVHNRLQ
jgi:hypothetical protein